MMSNRKKDRSEGKNENRRSTRKRILTSLLLILMAYLAFLFLHTPAYPAMRAKKPAESIDDIGWENAGSEKLLFLDISPYQAPETVCFQDGFLYASVREGSIIRLREDGSALEEIVHTGGMILGFEIDRNGDIYFCDSEFDTGGGALCVARKAEQYQVAVLADSVDGIRLAYPDALCLGPDDMIYFTNATDIPAVSSGTMASSVEACMARRSTGGLYVFDRKTGQVDTVAYGFYFTNGVQLSPDGRELFVNDTYGYQSYRIGIDERNINIREETVRTFVGPLPGVVDNMQRGSTGYWSGMPSPRIDFIDGLLNQPGLRNALINLPAFLYRNMASSPYMFHAICADEKGQIVRDVLFDEAFVITGVTETADRLYFHHISDYSAIPYLKNELGGAK